MGWPVGPALGCREGASVPMVGDIDGRLLGRPVGIVEGVWLGLGVGEKVGDCRSP